MVYTYLHRYSVRYQRCMYTHMCYGATMCNVPDIHVCVYIYYGAVIYQSLTQEYFQNAPCNVLHVNAHTLE